MLSKNKLENEMLLESQKAIDEDGADSIISYGNLGLINFLLKNLKVPVIDPVKSTVIFLESIIKLGLSHIKKNISKTREIINYKIQLTF